MKSQRLFAVPFGSEGPTGDSDFSPSKEEAIEIPSLTFTNTEAAFEQILAKYMKTVNSAKKPIGFWILTEENLDTALFAGEVSSVNDGQAYAACKVTKSLCDRLSVKVLCNHID